MLKLEVLRLLAWCELLKLNDQEADLVEMEEWLKANQVSSSMCNYWSLSAIVQLSFCLITANTWCVISTSNENIQQ